MSAEQQPLVLTSMLKRVDTAVQTRSRRATGRRRAGKAQVFGLAEDGISYSTSNKELMTQDIIDQMEPYKQKIIDGEIVVPTDPTA